MRTLTRASVAHPLRTCSAPPRPPSPRRQIIGREEQREVMVTVYNGNLGLVKDVREVRLPAGTNEI